MKTTILLSVALLFSITGNAQSKSGINITSGKIFYEEKAKLEINPSDEAEAAQLAITIPKERTSRRVLYFNSDFSLYQMDDSKKGEEVMRKTKGHTSMRTIASGENDKTFCDLKNNRKIEQKEFMTRTFLIDGKIDKPVWKPTGNSRTLLGYNCQEAKRTDKEKNISVWYTPSIPVSTGPSGYDGLPGLVLMVDINNGNQTITATSIDSSSYDESKFIMPDEGKKVTAEEYDKIVQEKLKEIRYDAGKAGNQE